MSGEVQGTITERQVERLAILLVERYSPTPWALLNPMDRDRIRDAAGDLWSSLDGSAAPHLIATSAARTYTAN